MARWVYLLLIAALAAAPALARAQAATPAPPSQLDLAAGPAIKLGVRGSGWVSVSQPALLAAGLDPQLDPGQLRLFADDVEQSVHVTGNGDSTFDADEAIEFWGVGRDTLWTDTRTYWLVAGSPGRPVPLSANPLGSAPPPNFPSSALLQQRKTYYAPLLNGDASNFFGDTVSTTAVTETLGVTHLDPSVPATLQIALQGITTGTHQVAITLNGQAAGSCTFSAQTHQLCPVSPAAVVEGPNQITLVASGDAPDYSLVDTVEIHYAHQFTADGDKLTLTVPPAARIAIEGFSSSDVRVVDVTDPDSPIELVTGIRSGGDGASYVVSASTAGDTQTHTLYAFTAAQIGAVASVTANHPSTWASATGGEVVILSNAAFIEAVQPLVDRRTAEGWSVALVDLQDVYDEFGGGDETVFAVRDFLQYAHTNWSIPPRFVLLVGDASFDPRNFLGLGDFDFAPTKLVDTAEMETASDDWFVDWNSDGVPDIAMGRLSVRTADEATTVVQKILSYQGVADLSQGGLFVADQNDGVLDFEGTSQTSASEVAGLLPTQSFFVSQPASTPAALIADLNQGPFLVNYTGHGSVEVWDDLFSDDDASALTNQKLSIYISMNCLNGFFHDVYTESLAEALTKAPGGGAVAAWASSTLSSFDPQAVLNQEFLKRLTRTSLGEAAMAAKAAITDIDARRTWILFGDPTLFGTPASKGGGQPPPADGGAPARDDGGAADGGRGVGARDGAADDGATDASLAVDAGRRDEAGSGADGGGADAAGGGSHGGCGCEIDPYPTSADIFADIFIAGLGIALVTARRRRRAQASGPER